MMSDILLAQGEAGQHAERAAFRSMEKRFNLQYSPVPQRLRRAKRLRTPDRVERFRFRTSIHLLATGILTHSHAIDHAIYYRFLRSELEYQPMHHDRGR